MPDFFSRRPLLGPMRADPGIIPLDAAKPPPPPHELIHELSTMTSWNQLQTAISLEGPPAAILLADTDAGLVEAHDADMQGLQAACANAGFVAEPGR